MSAYLQEILGHNPFWDLWETLLEVLQDVVVELRASLRHPRLTQRLNTPRVVNALKTCHVSFPGDAGRTKLSAKLL